MTDWKSLHSTNYEYFLQKVKENLHFKDVEKDFLDFYVDAYFSKKQDGTMKILFHKKTGVSNYFSFTKLNKSYLDSIFFEIFGMKRHSLRTKLADIANKSGNRIVERKVEPQKENKPKKNEWHYCFTRGLNFNSKELQKSKSFGGMYWNQRFSDYLDDREL